MGRDVADNGISGLAAELTPEHLRDDAVTQERLDRQAERCLR
jgi:hypothetical protein